MYFSLREGCPTGWLAHFLSLPREIRDRPYDEILNLNIPPSYPDSTQGECYHSIIISKSIPQASPTALLECNRRIRAQFSQHISSRSSSSSRKGLTYTLDLLVQAQNPEPSYRESMYPTWSRLPAIPIIIAESIHVSLRAVSLARALPNFDFSKRPSAPRARTYSLLNLLSRSLRLPTYIPCRCEDAKTRVC